MMKKISILIANYNNGRYFKDCFDSIIGQTYENWEVIIVDDASTDDSLHIIHNLTKDDSRFKVYENMNNKGCGYTKRKCVEYATGDFCGFLDPDDVLDSQALELSVDQLENNNKIVATYSQMMMCDADLNPQGTFKNVKQINNTPYFFNCPIQLAHFFVFRRKTYLQTKGINPELESAVDQDLYLKILDHGNAKFINQALYNYRVHPKGISQDDSRQKAKENFSKIILETMHRRGIKKIRNNKVPEQFNNSEEIFNLLEYQNHWSYRLKRKIYALLS